MKRKALGRGLTALLSQNVVEEVEKKTILELPLDVLLANHDQPRVRFDEEKLLELAESIKTHGVLQPLLVRLHAKEENKYVLIAGERRLRASRIADLKTVPCIVLPAEEINAMEIALVENLQRSDLSPVEEANAFRHLIERFSLTQEEVASHVGKSREAIANSLRLLHLPDKVLFALEEGYLTVGHAKVLLSVKDLPVMDSLVEKIQKEGLSVRETEKRVRNTLQPVTKKDKQDKKKEKDIHLHDLERSLEKTFQTLVRVKMSGKKKGKIEIQFYDLDHLDSILKKWNVRL